MAKDYDGSGQYTTFTLATGQHSLDQITIAHWIYPDSNAQYARTFDRYNSSTDDRTRWEFDDGWGWVFCAGWTSNEGKWSIAKPSTGVWTHGAVTYDWGSTSNDPILYKNGVSEAVNERATPSGTKENTGASLRFGANPSGSNLYNGKIAEFAIWNRILSAEEIAILAKGYSPLFIPNGLVFYTPLIRDTKELRYGLIGTDTNSPPVFDHPRVIYPTHFYFPAATAGGGTLYTKELSDTIGLSDNIARLVGKVQTDTITLTSTVASVATLYRTLTDSLALSSAVTSLRSTFVSLSDSISFSSAVTAAKTTSKTFSDSIGLTEAFTLIKSFGRSFSDSIGLSSAIEALVVGTKGLSDSISLTDTLSIILNSLSAGIPGKFKDAIRSIQKTGSRVVGVFKNNDPEGISFQKERPDADEVR